jgi:hypothetical protein
MVGGNHIGMLGGREWNALVGSRKTEIVAANTRQ